MSDTPLVERIENRGQFRWRTHTANLLQEIVGSNVTCSALRTPIRIFGATLFEVGQRASELNDPKLNALMCRLTLYACSDPHDANYDPELTRKVLDAEPD